jgi:hypothetical protein
VGCTFLYHPFKLYKAGFLIKVKIPSGGRQQRVRCFDRLWAPEAGGGLHYLEMDEDEMCEFVA